MAGMLEFFVIFAYYMLFQIMGLLISFYLLKQESVGLRILIGSVCGSVLLMWLPALAAIGLGFGVKAHGIAAIVAFCVIALAVSKNIVPKAKQCNKEQQHMDKKQYSKEQQHTDKKQKNPYFYIEWIMFGTTGLLFLYLLLTHTLAPAANGSLHTGQATNSDMNMHLAFITSIAKQGKFPPDYSVLPGNKLSYPFLCDSISSSLYLLSGNLRISYLFPMMVAFGQVMLGVYLLGRKLLTSRRKAILGWLFFFYNGGLGFIYFLPFTNQGISIKEMLYGFHQTPTNLVAGNIRWSNVIVDMLLPQRATLFGWAVLFPLLLLLYSGITRTSVKAFVMAGILAGSIPMIHTHSFLALGLICMVWMVMDIWGEFRNLCFLKWIKCLWLAELILLLVCGGMWYFASISYDFCFGLALVVVGTSILFCIITGILGITGKIAQIKEAVQIREAVQNGEAVQIREAAQIREESIEDFAKSARNKTICWIIFLSEVIVLAMPQLCYWTLKQAQGNHFLRGYFNWVNEENYIAWFYIKNIGVVLLLILIGGVAAKWKQVWLIGPGAFIWFLGEFLVFQPNTYDNNKLFYVAYLLLAMAGAHVFVEFINNRKMVWRVFGAFVIGLSTISALGSIAREVVSDYELYSAEEVALCQYIEEHTKPQDKILTDLRYNNPIAPLTGRNIVCGPESTLAFHGLDYEKEKELVTQMYQNPQDASLFEKNNVKYMLIGPSERVNFVIISEKSYENNFELIYSVGEYHFYKLKNESKRGG